MGSPWRLIWTGRDSTAAGRTGVIQAVPGFLQAGRHSSGVLGFICRPGLLQVLEYPGWSPAGLGEDFIVFRLFWD